MKQRLITLLATFTLMIGFVAVPVSSAYAAVTVDEAIDGATAKMLADGFISSDWEALAIARSNTPASKELPKTIMILLFLLLVIHLIFRQLTMSAQLSV